MQFTAQAFGIPPYSPDTAKQAQFYADDRCVGVHLKYSIPYYVVELVPKRWQSLILPDLAQTIKDTAIDAVESVLQPFFKPLGVDFSDPAPGRRIGATNYFEAHVFRLQFDIGRVIHDLIGDIAKAVATNGAVGIEWHDDWLQPDVCYISEVDPIRWRLGVPLREYKLGKEHYCWVKGLDGKEKEVDCQTQEEVIDLAANAMTSGAGVVGEGMEEVGQELHEQTFGRLEDEGDLGKVAADAGEAALTYYGVTTGKAIEGVGKAAQAVEGGVEKVVNWFGSETETFGEGDREIIVGTIDRRPEDKLRFFEGTTRPEPGFYSWGPINERSGWVVHGDPKVAAQTVAARAASVAAHRKGSGGKFGGCGPGRPCARGPGEPTDGEPKIRGCWLDGKGPEGFNTVGDGCSAVGARST